MRILYIFKLTAHAHCWGYGRAFGEMLPPTKKNITSVGKVTEFAHIDYTSNVNEIEEQEEGEVEEEEEEGEEEVVDEEEDSDDENLDSLHDQAHTAVLMERFQFKQISVGEGFSCGIVLQEEVANLTAVVHEGDLVCWGGHRKHSSMPHHVVGPFKQVSVGSMGVCAIYMGEEDMDMDHRRKGTKGPAPHNMKCWGFITNFVYPNDNAWDQVSIGSLSVCGVTMMSQLECWGTGIHDVKNMPRDIEIA